MHKLFTDGGSRGNPGHSGIGIVCLNKDNEKVFKFKKYIGINTNNQAEYVALLQGIKTCVKKGIKNLNCFADSELMVKQLNGEYKMKNAGLKPLYRQVKEMKKSFKSITFNHVPRAKNKIADSLVNQALDEYLS